MPAAPPKPEKLTRKATRLIVLLGPEDGSRPTKDDEVDYLIPIRIETSAGGSRVDSAMFAYDLAKQDERVVDRLVPKGVRRQIEIRELDKEGEVKRVLFWGKLSTEPVNIDGSGESITFVARHDPYVFGDPLRQVPYWDNGVDQAPILLDRPLVFNPLIDETVRANCSNKTDPDRDDAYLMFDAGGPDTAAARTNHGQTLTKWKIAQAVHFLCWLLNQHETYIQNPSLGELNAALLTLDGSIERLRNFAVPAGQRLPEVLDAILTPHGGGWYVSYTYDPTFDRTKANLKFFTRNLGTERELFLQRPGEVLKPSKSSTPTLSYNFDIGNLANVIIGKTSLKQREFTIELHKGWPVSQDGYDREVLMTTGKLTYPWAHRKWVANEAGAWTGLRPEITQPLVFTGEFGADPVLMTSRKCLPCLSRVADAETNALESRGIVVEWYNPDTDAWETVKWSFSKLEQEIGIFFSEPPQELWDLMQEDPDSVRIRVTCTIEGDCASTVTVAKTDASPNGDEIPLTLDLSDKFHSRALCSTGPLTSRFAGESATADIRDDTLLMEQYLTRLQADEDAADLAMSASLEGIDHPEWEIGQLVTAVNGRNLKLNRNNPIPNVDPKYLQCMGLTLNVQNQSMELLFESFEMERT